MPAPEKPDGIPPGIMKHTKSYRITSTETHLWITFNDDLEQPVISLSMAPGYARSLIYDLAQSLARIDKEYCNELVEAEEALEVYRSTWVPDEIDID